MWYQHTFHFSSRGVTYRVIGGKHRCHPDRNIFILLFQCLTLSREIRHPQLLLENLAIFIRFWTSPLNARKMSTHDAFLQEIPHNITERQSLLVRSNDGALNEKLVLAFRVQWGFLPESLQHNYKDV